MLNSNLAIVGLFFVILFTSSLSALSKTPFSENQKYHQYIPFPSLVQG